MNGYEIQQNTATIPLTFLLVSSSDHIAGLTGKAGSVVVTISKNAGAYGSPAGAISEVGNGLYAVAANSTDSNTLGPMWLHAKDAASDPIDICFPVVAYNPQSSSNLGLSALPTAAPAAVGGLPTCDASNGVKVSVGTGTGQINAASGKVPATLASTDVTGNVACDLQTIKTQTVTCAAGVTVGPFVGNATAALVVNGSGFVTVGTNSDKTGYSLTVTPPTAAAVATAVWQDTTAGDFTTAGSIGKSLFTAGAVPGAVGGLFIAGTNAATTITTSLTTHIIGTVDTVTTVTNQLTAAAIATGVWQDATAGDFTTASSIGKCLYIANVAPGAAGGHFIAGSNAATTVNITGNLSGSVGSVTGSVGSVTGAVASVAAAVTVGGYSSGQDPATLVLDVAIAGHETAGTVGAAIAAAGGSGDPWATALPGSYSAGTAGYIVGHNIDAAISTRSTYAGGAVASVTGSVGSVTGLTTATIATAVWQDATAGDFTAIGSIGKSLFTGGVVPGGANGLFIAGINAATTVTTSFTTTFTGNVTGSIGSVTGNIGGNVTGSVGSVTAAVTVSMSQLLGSPRALDSIADGSIQLNDALWAAIGAGVGKADASNGTQEIISTPSTGTALRTFTLTAVAGTPSSYITKRN